MNVNKPRRGEIRITPGVSPGLIEPLSDLPQQNNQWKSNFNAGGANAHILGYVFKDAIFRLFYLKNGA